MDLREMLTINWARSINTASLSELYKWLLISAEQVDASVFYSGKHYLNFRDKAYNWKEDRFEINRKRMYFTYALNYNYPEEESNGAFNKFMNDVFEEDEDSKLEFAKFVGLALSGIRSLKYVFFLLGPALRKILCKKKTNQTMPVNRADGEILLLIALFPEWERGMRASA
jgi:phage/plasmid-associated DNA primase